MRIALVKTNFPLDENGHVGFPAAWEMARSLKALGHDVIVCTIGGADQPAILEREVGGVKVYAARWDDAARRTCFDGVRSFNVFSWQTARARTVAEVFGSILDQFNPDVIECQEYNALGFFLAARRKHPMVIRCYGPMSLLMRSGDCGQFPIADTELVESMELATLANADGLISLCRDIAVRLAKQTGRPESDWDVVLTPFSVERNSLNAATEPANSSSTSDTQQSLFFWGRVERQKGVDLLAEAFGRLTRQFPNLRLIIAGQETTEEGTSEPFSNILRARLRELGLLDKVEFRGFLSREEISKQARLSTVCVFPSRYETACYACLEAIAYGGVAVAAKAGGLPEYHEHGTSAWLVEPDSVDSLTAGLTEVLSSQSLRNELLLKGPGYIAKACDPALAAAKSVEAYKKAIANFASRQMMPASGASYERAFKLLAAGLQGSLAGEPLYMQFPAAETPAPSATVGNLLRGAARATKRMIVGRHKGDR